RRHCRCTRARQRRVGHREYGAYAHDRAGHGHSVRRPGRGGSPCHGWRFRHAVACHCRAHWCVTPRLRLPLSRPAGLVLIMYVPVSGSVRFNVAPDATVLKPTVPIGELRLLGLNTASWVVLTVAGLPSSSVLPVTTTLTS